MPDLRTRENTAVENYLRFLASGELPVDETKQAKLEALDERIAAEDTLWRKAQLIGDRHALAAKGTTKESLEEAFVKYVGGFVSRHPNITYAVWREMGVTPAMLKRAGIEGVPGAVRAPGEPRRTRNNLNDPETARAILSTAMSGGRSAVIEQYGYAENYVAGLCRGLVERHPQVAAELGYDQNTVFPMSPIRTADHAKRKAATKR